MVRTLVGFLLFVPRGNCSIRMFDVVDYTCLGFGSCTAHWLFNSQKAPLRWSVNLHTEFQAIPVDSLPCRCDITFTQILVITSWILMGFVQNLVWKFAFVCDRIWKKMASTRIKSNLHIYIYMILPKWIAGWILSHSIVCPDQKLRVWFLWKHISDPVYASNGALAPMSL